MERDGPRTTCLFARVARARGATLALTLFALACAGDGTEPATDGPLELTGGLWFDGAGFRAETVYVVDSVLTRTAPDHVGETMDLAGGYVIPPLTESHTHTLVSPPTRNAGFLDAGIFYAGVMNDFVSNWTEVKDQFNTPESVDVKVALAGFTATDGHPLQIGERTGRSDEELDGDWLTLVDSEADLDAKWPGFLAHGSDIVKVFLVNSEEYAERHGNPDSLTRYRGLDPTLLPAIVEKAHAAGLPVAVHVRTAEDYRAAVDAGVDQIAHLPGFAMGPSAEEELQDSALLAELDHPERFTLTAADAAATAEAGIAVHTTLVGLMEVPDGLPEELVDLVEKAIAVGRQVQSTNLELLMDAGVDILLGSDAGEQNVRDEIVYLEWLGVMSPLQLLTAGTVTSTQRLFPDRMVGSLADGYEASFLVLGADPRSGLSDALSDIRLRVKEGHVLQP